MNRNIKMNKQTSLIYDYIPKEAIQVNTKNEKIMINIIILIIMIATILFINFKQSYMMFDFDLKFSFLGVVIAIFPCAIVHEFIHAIAYPKNTEVIISFKPNGFNTKINTFGRKKLSKYQALYMLIMPLLILGTIPILISFTLQINNSFESFMFFLGVTSLSMASNDLYYFVFLYLRMSKTDLLIQDKKHIYFLKKGGFYGKK